MTMRRRKREADEHVVVLRLTVYDDTLDALAAHYGQKKRATLADYRSWAMSTLHTSAEDLGQPDWGPENGES